MPLEIKKGTVLEVKAPVPFPLGTFFVYWISKTLSSKFALVNGAQAQTVLPNFELEAQIVALQYVTLPAGDVTVPFSMKVLSEETKDSIQVRSLVTKMTIEENGKALLG